MRKYSKYIAFIFVLIIGFSLMGSYTAHAQTAAQQDSAATAELKALAAKGAGLAANAIVGNGAGVLQSVFGYDDMGTFVATVVANWGNIMLSATSWLVALTGTLLNVSINITLHIRDFVNSTPAIFDVWKAIRDISGMFIIFFLLYAAIRKILGISSPGFDQLIKTIIVAGVLINFSFFITGVLIDASNMVSLTLYRAIVPGQTDIGPLLRNQTASTAGSPIAAVSGSVQTGIEAISNKLFNDGGISALFMQSLKVQANYNSKIIDSSKTNQVAAIFRIILTEFTGILIMITVSISFLVASLAFIARLVILLFLLAFSPVLFAAGVVPELKSYSTKWWGHLKGQLIFMPVYLLLLYTSLLIMTKSTVFKTAGTGNLWQGGQMTGAPTEFIALFINAVFIIIMLNIPLIAAFSMGGHATGWLGKLNIGADKVWKKAGNIIGTRTVGRAASAADKYFANTRPGNSLLGRDIRAYTTGALAKNKLGLGRSYDERQTAQKDVDAKKGQIMRARDLSRLLGKAGTTSAQNKALINKMSQKEKLELDVELLKNPNVIKHFKKADFDAINKPDTTTISADDKAAIKAARATAFSQAISGTDAESAETVKHMLQNTDTDDLKALFNDKPSENKYLQSEAVIGNLTIGQLKALSDGGLNTDAKKIIGDKIDGWKAGHGGHEHSAFSHVSKNRADWTTNSVQAGNITVSSSS